MKWLSPPSIKIYEALGSISDDRIELTSKKSARVYSSSRLKYYEVEFDRETNSITSNDNGSFYVGYLGYPSIALLFKLDFLSYNEEFAQVLRGIQWKDLNQTYKNDFEKVMKYVHEQYLIPQSINIEEFESYIETILKEIEILKLNKFKSTNIPPKQY